MNKIILFLFALCLPALSHALYMGNPSDPELIEKGFFISEESAFGVKAGYLGDFVFDRNIEAHGNVHGRIDNFWINANQGVITLDVYDRLELYGSVGAMQISFSHRPSSDHKRREYDFHDQFTWGAGGKVILFEWGNVCFGGDGKYQQASPDLRWVTVNGASVKSDSSLIYREWQGGVAFSYRAGLFTPYIGGTYSHVHSQLKHISADVGLDASAFSLRSREHFGLVLGCSLSKGKIVDLNVEVKFFDENALAIAGDIQF